MAEEAQTIQETATPVAKQEVDMTGAIEKATRKGVYLSKTVADVTIPAEFQDKFLTFDNKTKTLNYVVKIRDSPEQIAEKEKRRAERNAKVAENKVIQLLGNLRYSNYLYLPHISR